MLRMTILMVIPWIIYLTTDAINPDRYTDQGLDWEVGRDIGNDECDVAM
jgi:hypothetical protein